MTKLSVAGQDAGASVPMRRKTAQVAFIFEYLFGSMSRYGNGEWAGGCDVCTSYDDGQAFVAAFAEKFPGRLPDINFTLASNRMRRLVKEMTDDGWLERFRLGNHDQYHPAQEPNWQYVYSIPAEYAEKLRKGQWTAEYMARRYLGDGDAWLALRRESEIDADILRDGNAWYSGNQLAEMAARDSAVEGIALKDHATLARSAGQ